MKFSTTNLLSMFLVVGGLNEAFASSSEEPINKKHTIRIRTKLLLEGLRLGSGRDSPISRFDDDEDDFYECLLDTETMLDNHPKLSEILKDFVYSNDFTGHLREFSDDISVKFSGHKNDLKQACSNVGGDYFESKPITCESKREDGGQEVRKVVGAAICVANTPECANVIDNFLIDLIYLYDDDDKCSYDESQVKHAIRGAAW
eukprot:CAMPEP_0116135802 /NCGR_PEP_ID=MMETSP0329-20121206/11387_1 /TAXON_ID=697910 /ORGANISM="Pseudo-nitzschia arenysensis, Strain B593" /LENGTH=202 /DNA_ID=CAMNT_0003630631 /DNA_START=11 /DNA_END=619 /DNA_ORIENTATION=-